MATLIHFLLSFATVMIESLARSIVVAISIIFGITLYVSVIACDILASAMGVLM